LEEHIWSKKNNDDYKPRNILEDETPTEKEAEHEENQSGQANNPDFPESSTSSPIPAWAHTIIKNQMGLESTQAKMEATLIGQHKTLCELNRNWDKLVNGFNEVAAKANWMQKQIVLLKEQVTELKCFPSDSSFSDEENPPPKANPTAPQE